MVRFRARHADPLLDGLVPEVIVLPNNGNVLMAAQQAQAVAEDEGKKVRVVPSKTIPQGISALLALNAHGDLERNAAAMTSALAPASAMTAFAPTIN